MGVSDKKHGPDAFLGTQYDADWCRQRIHELVTPSLITDAFSFTFNNKRLVYIRVPRGVDVHEYDGRFQRRVGTSCERMSAAEIAALSNERRQFDWSADTSAVPANVLSDTAVNTMREQLKRISQNQLDLVPTNDSALLTQFKLTAQEGKMLNNAGAIALGNDPDLWPRVKYSYKTLGGAEPQYQQTVQAPLLETLQTVLTLVNARSQFVPLNLQDGTQLQIADFPTAAVREAIANALLHSNYRNPASITVEHSNESLRISSPGRLPHGVTPDNILTHSSQPRNSRLFRLAEQMRVAEERGLGVDRMVRESIRAGNPAPEILELGTNTLVVFTKGNRKRSALGFIATLPQDEQSNVDTLLVLNKLLSSKTLDCDGAARLIQKTTDEATNVLARLAGLAQTHLIEATQESKARRHPVYRLTASALRQLGSAVSYNKPPADDIERKVVAHLREYEKLSNKTLRNLLDVDVYKARDILARLVRDEIIVRTSAQSRGRNVEYGPGERFNSIKNQ